MIKVSVQYSSAALGPLGRIQRDPSTWKPLFMEESIRLISGTLAIVRCAIF